MGVMNLYNLATWDESIFDNLTLPSPLEKDALINTIFLKYGVLSPIQSNPDRFKKMVGFWSTANKYTFETLAKTLEFEYNPIHNVDENIFNSYDDRRNFAQTQKSHTDVDVTQENVTSAYNADNYQPADKNITDNTNDYQHGLESEDSVRHDFRQRRYGNIGVTSTQNLIKQEREIAMFNIYDTIARMFCKDFLIQVYPL